jgi:threonine aldolase
MIDLRSDTVTHPTPSMWEAISHAEVGDDVYLEDPTVNHLEQMAADLMGKQAALFVTSGTMGNLIAILAHCSRGDEAIVGKRSHIFIDEVGGAAGIAGVQLNTLPNQPDGTLLLEDIIAATRSRDDIHLPHTSMIALENTHAECGGVTLTAEYTQRVGELARSNDLKLHIDGARLFNAAAALEVPARELAQPADSVTFCLSKGLCAPVGSMLCGSREFIQRARKIRKQLGGGMRQVGILAAAGIVALEENIDRLAEDHRRMKALAGGLKGVEGLKVDFKFPPDTNILFLSLGDDISIDAEELYLRLKTEGLLCMPYGGKRFRLVTHYWITDDDIEHAISIFQRVLRL